jgi:hypothetical protein
MTAKVLSSLKASGSVGKVFPMGDLLLPYADTFSVGEIRTICDAFHIKRDQLKIKAHPLAAEKMVLHIDYRIPLGQAAAVCTYLNSYFFENIDSLSDRLIFHPSLKAFVASTPAQSDLYVTCSPQNKSRLLAFVTAHSDEISYVLGNIGITSAFRPHVTFSRARAQVESGLYPL